MHLLKDNSALFLSIYLSGAESEESKQASHPFVENVVHAGEARHKRRKLSSSTQLTEETKGQIAEQVKAYCNTITADTIREAQQRISSKREAATRAGRTLTSQLEVTTTR
eukprot:scpid103136/ scgid32924/ 